MIFWNTNSVFIRVPKTGSTSILYSLLECSDECTEHQFNKVFDALKPQFLYENYGDDPNHVSYEVLNNNTCEGDRKLINSFFKFAFVRNPFDRVVSIYKYMQQHDGIKCSENFVIPSDFKEFVSINLINHTAEDGIWFSDQTSQVIDCDFIGRFETLQSDFDIVCKKLGITRKSLPMKNRTSHKHYSEYYDEETVEIVARKYRADIIRFGYKFEKPV